MVGPKSATRVQVRGTSKREEDALQRAAIIYLRAALDNAIFRVVHVPNEGKRSAVQGAKLKAAGMLPGFPDIVIIGPDKPHFIEMKTLRGVLSPEQKDFRTFCTRNDLPYAVCRSTQDVVDAARGWGLTRRAAA